MTTLDLHGTKHDKAEEKIRSFLNFANLPCEIITGNSPEMKRMVKIIVDEYEWHLREKDNYNHGALIISERKYK
jgi:DNA-nicking Smr family endonuclease